MINVLEDNVRKKDIVLTTRINGVANDLEGLGNKEFLFLMDPASCHSTLPHVIKLMSRFLTFEPKTIF